MPNFDLEVLAQHRDALLLAEVGAWLHNIGKFSEEFVYSQFARAGNAFYADYANFKYEHVVGIVADLYTDPSVVLPSDARMRLTDMLGTWDVSKTLGFLLNSHAEFVRWLRHTTFRLPHPLDDREYSLGDLIEFQDFKWHRGTSPLIQQLFPSGSRATELLESSHNAGSGVEKGPAAAGAQSKEPIYASSAFGYEMPLNLAEWSGLRQKLIAIVQANWSDKQALRPLLTRAVADTQRPLNEVTLWDISSAVASFYKAAAAKTILEKQWTGRDDFKWRLLRVGIDGLGFYGQTARLPDLLARRDRLMRALDAVHRSLAERCVIGNEVYRDEGGSIFLVPDLAGDADQGTQLKGLVESEILRAFADSDIGGEVIPQLLISKGDTQGLTLADVLKEKISGPQASPAQVAAWWNHSTGDVCPVCGLRPQGPSEKARDRKVCDVCERRRADRAEKWASDLRTTIWTDEVADVNGRLALVVGQFDLKE